MCFLAGLFLFFSRIESRHFRVFFSSKDKYLIECCSLSSVNYTFELHVVVCSRFSCYVCWQKEAAKLDAM